MRRAERRSLSPAIADPTPKRCSWPQALRSLSVPPGPCARPWKPTGRANSSLLGAAPQRPGTGQDGAVALAAEVYGPVAAEPAAAVRAVVVAVGVAAVPVRRGDFVRAEMARMVGAAG